MYLLLYSSKMLFLGAFIFRRLYENSGFFTVFFKPFKKIKVFNRTFLYKFLAWNLTYYVSDFSIFLSFITTFQSLFTYTHKETIFTTTLRDKELKLLHFFEIIKYTYLFNLLFPTLYLSRFEYKSHQFILHWLS